MSLSKFDSMWNIMSKYTLIFSDKSGHDDLRCVMCKELMKDAVLSNMCGCHYCYQCFSVYTSEEEKYCPGDQEYCKDGKIILGLNVVKSYILNKRISKLCVKCPNESCDCYIELIEMDDHLRLCTKHKMECPYFAIGCIREKSNKDEIMSHLRSDTIPHSELLIELIINLKNEHCVFKDEFVKNKLEIDSLKEQLRYKEERVVKLEKENESNERRQKKEIENLRIVVNDLTKDVKEALEKNKWEISSLKDELSKKESQQGHENFWRNKESKSSGDPNHVELGIADSPLLYVTFKQRLESGEELSQTEKLVRQIKWILNRIVPQNFDQCLIDLVSLEVGTHEGMTCLVNEIFLKAVKEEIYSATFAKICSCLASIKADVNENEIVTFRTVLIKKCQAMFTTPLEEQLEKVRQDWLERAAAEKPKTKALMEGDVEEQVKKAKDRYYGNIRFIGELCLKGVLITKIIYFCIENLMMKEINSDSLICLCKLLEICGSKLETQFYGKEKLNNACKALRDIAESKITETRVRFKILDILEMRDKKWSLRKVQRKQEIEPNTLDEIKLEKEMENEKDYYHSLNRRNADRRQSLPRVNKNRSSITPKQLSLNSSEPTTFCKLNRNWVYGSGHKSKCDNTALDKRLVTSGHISRRIPCYFRPTRPKHRLGLNASDISQIAESNEVSGAQLSEPDTEGYLIDPLPLPSSQSPAKSSQNSSRSSSHGRSIPSTLSKDKSPDSKLAQAITMELKLFNPDQLLKVHMTNNAFCEHSWNSYVDKVTVVYTWLDMNFDTNSDKRRSLGYLLSAIINKGLLDKEDLLKAFTKLLDRLEDQSIDVSNALWNSFMDYLIPFIESMDMSSIDIIENIFNADVFQKFCLENAAIIFSLPWSMINGILKFPDSRISQDLFKLAIRSETKEDLDDCNRRLLDIIEINILKAIGIKYGLSEYENWFHKGMKEALDVNARRYFLITNCTALLSTITPNTCLDDKLLASFKLLCPVCPSADLFQTIANMCHDQSVDDIDILCKLWYLSRLGLFDPALTTSSTLLPHNLTRVLASLKSKSALTNPILCDSFQSFLSKTEPGQNDAPSAGDSSR